jgi:hypothetical protein
LGDALLVANPEPSRVEPWVPPQPPARRRLHWLRLVVPLIALAVVAGFAITESTWDPRLAPLAEFVAEIRGLEFLTQEEWAATVAIDESGLSAEDRSDDAEYVASRRAMGVIEGDIDRRLRQPGQTGGRFSKNADIPSCASSVCALSTITPHVSAYAFFSSTASCA